MYKTPAYPGYPFLMLPDPYLPNSSVSPSVSTPSFWIFPAGCFVPVAVCCVTVSCFDTWMGGRGIRSPLCAFFRCSQCKFVHFSWDFLLRCQVQTQNTWFCASEGVLLDDCKWLIFAVCAGKTNWHKLMRTFRAWWLMARFFVLLFFLSETSRQQIVPRGIHVAVNS